ncbi:zinc finger protein 709 isoform X2 [Oryzias latipes]|uniref:C2H2-type domain-containing protein n=1 Tax=Oryzias latipes TaxID=8090 RepID=H2MAF5_ORYLA|nr:zinc finger protein 709 isoform X2 [Oryzias latipes]
MDTGDQTVVSKGRFLSKNPGGTEKTSMNNKDSLPLASLRLLVPPFQLVTASMWQVLKQQDVKSYWDVAEFVSMVGDMVPELLMAKHRWQLTVGLRSRYILELCQGEQPVKPECILSYLEKIRATRPSLTDGGDLAEQEVTEKFLEMIQILLKDPGQKRDFFTEVFPAEYGPQYDNDLQTLFSEFVCRLAQLLPVPDLEQTTSWLRYESSVVDDCLQTLSDPSDLKNLLQHHKNLGHLEQHVPPSCMGETILSSLSAVSCLKVWKPAEQPSLSRPQQSPSAAPLVEDVAVEIITVSESAEVVIAASSNTEAMVAEKYFEVAGPADEDALTVSSDQKSSREEVEKEACSQHKITVGLHECPDCNKRFKFASSLLAHSVIHSGVRPHHCSDCGRSFSFRQSLDRHRHTHRSGRTYDCAVCGETFRSLSARTEHKHVHMQDRAYTCSQCNRRFSLELSLARHLKTHLDGGLVDKASDSGEDERPAECISQDHTEAEDLRDDDSSREFLRGQRGSSSDPAEVSYSDIPMKVRTSGRKRTPTMKIQVINLQKHMSNQRRKDSRKTRPPTPRPSICSEHSYGSPVITKQDFSMESSLGRDFQDESIVQPEETADEKPTCQVSTDEEGHFNCPDCEKSFRFLSLLKAHRRVHTGEQPFSCSQCGWRFSFKQSLDRHEQTHKSGHKYTCLICGDLCKSAADLTEHQSGHMEDGEYLCSECGQTFSWRSALVRHLRTHGMNADMVEDPYKCPYCSLSFSCASYLKRHIQTHQEERVHACSCGKSFTYRAALTAHQRTHQKERPHTCTQCGKGFLYKGGLLSHMKIHSEEMPFMCSFCGKSFKRERNMKKHERCHTRENVFRCSQCDKSFVYKATLIRHELTHSGERPYLCSDCGKGFFSHAELLKHERFHTGHKPFQCSYCDKKFTQSCYLTIHLRYHTGARPYTCAECDKSFLSANRLKRHQRTHTGEKPYPCMECGKGFKQSYHLKMHQRTHVS